MALLDSISALPTSVGGSQLPVLFAAMPVGVFVLDPANASILACNDLAAEQLGYARDEFVRLSVPELNPDMDDAEALERVRQVITAGRPVRFETRHRHRAGELRDMLVTAHPVEIDGQIRVLVTALDVSERRNADRALEEFRRSEATLGAVLDALPLGVVIADADGRVLRDNAAHRGLWGVPPETTYWEQYGEYVGYRNGERLRADDWAMARSLLRGEVVHGELVECERFDTRERRRYLNNSAPVRDDAGRIVGGVVVELDLTGREAAERELVETAERVQLALDAGAIVGTWNWHLPTDHFTADERFARSFGLDPARCRAGLGIDAVVANVHPDDIDRLRAAIAAVIARGGPYSCEYRVRQHDGVYRWIEANGRVELDADGTPLRFPGVLLNVETRKQTEARLRAGEQRFRTAAEAASDILWTNDPEGRMTGEQPGWAAFTGQSRAQYEGYGWAAAVHPDDAQRSIDSWKQAVATRSKYVNEHRVRRHDGAWRTFSVRALPVLDPDGTIREWVGVHTDVTEIRQAQAVIERQNAELRDADRRKDEFLATLAHELRNPLAPIRNALQILNQSRDPAIATQARAMMGRQVSQLVRLVDDLLEISRITTGKLKISRDRLDVRRIVEQAIETARPEIESRRHRLVVRQPDRSLRVDGDAVRLAQVLTNLLTNAAKYSELGGTITVAVSLPSPQRVRVDVTDTGIGLAPESIPRAFELFAQIEHGFDKAQGGLGIGLALARRLAELHGGTLTATSPGLGMGATFALDLPLAGSLVRTDGCAAEIGRTESTGRRIVVADDNRDAADSLAIMLKLQGHDVSTCYDGRAAIGVVRRLQPDVAILDLGMPGCDGLEVARTLRDDPGDRPLVLIALTGWGQEDDKRRTRAAGFDHHFTKPVELAALDAVLSADPAGVPAEAVSD